MTHLIPTQAWLKLISNNNIKFVSHFSASITTYYGLIVHVSVYIYEWVYFIAFYNIYYLFFFCTMQPPIMWAIMSNCYSIVFFFIFDTTTMIIVTICLSHVPKMYV